METSPFMKLKGGAVIFVTRINKQQEVIHGYNLESRYLRIKSFNLSKIDETWTGLAQNLADLTKAVVKNFYFVEVRNNHHSPRVTKKRFEVINKAIEKILAERASSEEVKPFHESVVAILSEVATPEALGDICKLILNTKIPKNFEKIAIGVILAQKRLNKSADKETLNMITVHLKHQAVLEKKKEELKPETVS